MSAPALLNNAELRVVEQRFRDASPPLMERAGRASAVLAASIAGERGGPIVIVAGPGNNGGDAWVAAQHLAQSFHRVTVFDVMGTAPRASEAVAAKAAYGAGGGTVVREWPASVRPSLVIDGVLGIGSTRVPEGAIAAAIERINASGARVLALDIASGIDADTGVARGAAVRADDTLTFIAMKPGLFTGDGVEHSGVVHLDDLDLGAELGESRGMLLEWEAVRAWLEPRRANAHKGSHGTLGILGGAAGMTGAAILAGRAALRTGAGKVLVGLYDERAPAFDPEAPELMLRKPADVLDADALVAGPGSGSSPALATAIAFEKPIVLDADSLNDLAKNAAHRKPLKARKAATILTPHPGEAARLLNTDTKAIQADRIASALRMAEEFNAHVVLKGAGSIVAHPDGTYAINTTGNPGLASGGTGDALAGMIGAMLCQGLDAPRALAFAVCLHGAAADACVARGVGPVGLTASDVILEARALVNSEP
ncbi:Bifunctional NAD(P)H-hydrate repair enzyme Nnr [Usitatibacter rugosus]|uniref:Bifunctional NAD(P)H-hydrate repair enzyme n=1 Tax=Usitatibacter rugosus TaxID=2732067 RepID=A0A6M4GXU5_9PROT|nr:NAD(P)H-hydrate dehydratase [Usitatibacter rugosus]QJR11314.1 Bifunctional NAD(P)H-hydrate repair enzyme Nnr [Usitatibacter rugosus]